MKNILEFVDVSKSGVGKISCVAALETASAEGVGWFIGESYKQQTDTI